MGAHHAQDTGSTPVPAIPFEARLLGILVSLSGWALLLVLVGVGVLLVFA